MLDLLYRLYPLISYYLGFLLTPIIIFVLFAFLVYFASIGISTKFKKQRQSNKVALAKEQRAEFISFIKKFPIVVFFGPPKTGKTAHMNMIANLSPLEWEGYKYTSFPTSSIYAQPFNIHSIDLYAELKLLPRLSTILIDEFNQIGDFTNPNDPDFKKRMEGFLRYVPYVGHRRNHLFVGNQRAGGGVWNAVRGIANLFLRTIGHEKIGNDFLFTFETSENEEMNRNLRSWTIWLSPHDMSSYDPEWMDDVLGAKNTVIDFAKKVGSKHILDYVEKLEEIAKSSGLTGVDENVLSIHFNMYKQQLSELVAISKYKKQTTEVSLDKTNNRIPRFASKEKETL